LRNFGLRVGIVGAVKFEARIRELVADHPDLAAIVEPWLFARRVLREQHSVLHRQLLAVVRNDEVSADYCNRRKLEFRRAVE
jgi:transposase